MLATDSYHGKLGSNNDGVTNDGTLNLEYVEAGATVEYQVLQQIGRVNVNDASVPDVWTAQPALHEGANFFVVRVTDVAGNRNDQQFSFTLDTEAPDTPAIALHNAPNNGSATPGLIDITGLEQNTGTAWEYTTDKGKSWTYGDTNDGSGMDTLELSAAGNYSVQVRQYDVAGNISARTAALDFTISTTPTLEVSFDDAGISLTSSIAGEIVMLTSGPDSEVESTETDGRAIAGTVQIGAQVDVSSGTFAVNGSTSQALDQNKGVYTLGTIGSDVIVNARTAWGFDGEDNLSGTDDDDLLFGGADTDTLSGGDGNDTLHGGDGNDTIDGGLNGDLIIVSAGTDRLTYITGAESNLSTYVPGSQSASSIDMVQVGNTALVLFDFTQDVQQVFRSLDNIDGASDLETLYAQLTAAYNDVAQSRTDAVIFDVYDFKLMVVNNGDAVIDNDDIAIAIIGSGQAYTDGAGNVYFGNVS